jgi:kinesin family member 2/24
MASRGVKGRIDAIAAQREARREKMAAYKEAREKEAARLQKKGILGDVDFQSLIEKWRVSHTAEEEHRLPGDLRICIACRKRPEGPKEVARRDYDSVTVANPRATVHYPKTKVDGITKFIENQAFSFDHVSVGGHPSPLASVAAVCVY